MRMLIALRDTKTGSFLAPLTASTPGEAERTYGEILSSQNTIVGKHPGDFPLYEIGKFDEFTGQVYPLCDDAGIGVLPRLLLDAGQLRSAGAVSDPRQLSLEA